MKKSILIFVAFVFVFSVGFFNNTNKAKADFVLNLGPSFNAGYGYGYDSGYYTGGNYGYGNYGYGNYGYYDPYYGYPFGGQYPYNGYYYPYNNYYGYNNGYGYGGNGFGLNTSFYYWQ